MARVMGSVRSGPSTKTSYLRFINRTSRKVNVVWIDYGGYAVNYGTLEPERHFDIHTYEGHPWISEDSTLRTRMLLNKEMIFYPSASDQECAQPNRELRNYLPLLTNQANIQNGNDDLHQWRREIVYITLPVLTLLERSCEVVNSNLHDRRDAVELNIPRRLKSLLLEPYFLQHYFA